jgi:hypothetical protein
LLFSTIQIILLIFYPFGLFLFRKLQRQTRWFNITKFLIPGQNQSKGQANIYKTLYDYPQSYHQWFSAYPDG